MKIKERFIDFVDDLRDNPWLFRLSHFLLFRHFSSIDSCGDIANKSVFMSCPTQWTIVERVQSGLVLECGMWCCAFVALFPPYAMRWFKWVTGLHVVCGGVFLFAEPYYGPIWLLSRLCDYIVIAQFVWWGVFMAASISYPIVLLQFGYNNYFTEEWVGRLRWLLAENRDIQDAGSPAFNW